MHIKVDEDLPAQATQRLRAEGYDASSVVEQKMGGWRVAGRLFDGGNAAQHTDTAGTLTDLYNARPTWLDNR